MPRKGTRDLAKEQYWRGVIHEWRSSDRNVADFCRRHGYTYSQFQKWQRIIRQRNAEMTIAQRKSVTSNGTRRKSARNN